MRKFIPGDKVKIPKTKLLGFNTLESSTVYMNAFKKNQKYLYVTGYENDRVILDWYYDSGNYDHGDYYSEDELELYTEKITNWRMMVE